MDVYCCFMTFTRVYVRSDVIIIVNFKCILLEINDEIEQILIVICGDFNTEAFLFPDII